MVSRSRLVCWIPALMVGLGLAGAGPSVVAQAEADTEAGPLVDLFSWDAPPVEEQLAADSTSVPEGMGALFVPTLSEPASEPKVLVFRGNARVASGPTGQRLVIPPGDYVVRVGSGALSQMAAIEVAVPPDETVVVPVEWAGLVLEVVDEDNIPHRGSYELIRAADRELYGLGFGADTLQGEQMRTWLLPPGLYRIVRPGSSYRARTDFATVYLLPGGLVHYKLVLNPETGELRGAGVVAADEFASPVGLTAWTHQILLGLNAGFSQTHNLVGQDDQLIVTGELFADSLVGFDDGTNFFVAILEVEEGVEGEPVPSQVSQDRIRLELLYSHFLHDLFGPYVRFQALGAVFPIESSAENDLTLRRRLLDGAMVDEVVAADEFYRTGGPLPSVALREGIGANLRLLNTTWATTHLRVGVGFRQSFFNDFFTVEDDPDTVELELTEVGDFTRAGLEGMLSGDLRLTGFLTYTTELEVFTDFEAFDAPDLYWSNTLSLRLASFVALDYTLDLLLEREITDDLQLSQDVLLRFSWELL
ncbi:MAG: hypothetical protein JW797_18605 [Bradymonadales bacterium]|nr:hypothetical protein [Bradymonadales bacterium]